MSWESQVVGLLSASLVRPFVLVAAAFLVLRVFRVKHPASRHAVWTAVLVGMLALPFLSAMTRHWTLPVLPRKQEPAQVVPAAALADIDISTIPAVVAPQPISTPARQISPESLIVWFYLTGVFAMLAYRVAGWVLLLRVVSRSKRLATPWLRESHDVVAPVALGILRPAVLLPASWRDWSHETRKAVLTHEFAHIQRRDALVSSLARLLKCVFWFHPLAWWVSGKVAELAELACDAVALERVGDPAGYSRVLLQFAGGVNVAGHRVALPGLAMAAPSGLSKRIDQVFEVSGGNLRRLRRPGAVLVLVGIPAICLGATLGLGERHSVMLAPITTKLLHQLVAQTRTQAPTLPPVGVPKPAPPPVRDRGRTELDFQTASIEIAGPPVSGELYWSGCGGPLSPYPESRNQITYRHFTLKKILLRAYNLKDAQIAVPSSLDNIAYNVEATAAPGTTQEQFQVMLRNLFAERLHLTMHEELRDFAAGYDLVVADGGPKLQESKAPALGPAPAGLAGPRLFGRNGLPVLPVSGDNGENKLQNLTLPLLAGLLTNGFNAPVADKTGLTEAYDMSLVGWMPFPPRARYAGSQVSASQPDALATARRGLAQLGLALQEKPPLSLTVLVVDHVDAAPAGN